MIPAAGCLTNEALQFPDNLDGEHGIPSASESRCSRLYQSSYGSLLPAPSAQESKFRRIVPNQDITLSGGKDPCGGYTGDGGISHAL